MGDGKRKKERFKVEHPWCCFCGGTVAATSVDHIPARTCFRNREYPHGFEFPACDHCQAASRLDEIAFAFWVRALDHTDDNLTNSDFEKLLSGLLNNLPDLAPRGVATRQGKRQALRRMGIRMPAGLTLDEAPIVEIDPRLHDYIHRYARKIALALYYREQGRIAKASHRVLAMWGQESDRSFVARSQRFYNMTPLQTIGARPNVNIGNQFRYQCNKADDPDLFAALASFGSLGMTLLMVVVSDEAASKLANMADGGVDDAAPHWKLASENYPRPSGVV